MSTINNSETNPCLKEQEQSYKCLDQNGYDQDKCKIYFENYNTCKKFWSKVKSDRRKLGIYPHLPAEEDRAKVKAQYFGK